MSKVNNLQKKKRAIEDVLSSRGRVRILKLLAKCNELNISAIAKETNLNHGLVKEHLKFLTEAGLIKEKRFGRILIYQYQNNDIIANALKKLFLLWENEKDPQKQKNV